MKTFLSLYLNESIVVSYDNHCFIKLVKWETFYYDIANFMFKSAHTGHRIELIDLMDSCQLVSATTPCVAWYGIALPVWNCIPLNQHGHLDESLRFKMKFYMWPPFFFSFFSISHIQLIFARATRCFYLDSLWWNWMAAGGLK